MQTRTKVVKIGVFSLILGVMAPLQGNFTLSTELQPNVKTLEKAQDTQAYMEQVASLNLFLKRSTGGISAQDYELLEILRQTLLSINTQIQDRYAQYLDTLSEGAGSALPLAQGRKVFLEDEISREESAFWEAYKAFYEALPHDMRSSQE